MDERTEGVRSRIFVSCRDDELRALGAQLSVLQPWALNLAGRHPARGPAQPYVWTRQPPHIRVKQPAPSHSKPYTPGQVLISVRTDGAIEDEYVLAFLVHTLTASPGAAVLNPAAQLSGSDGEFLLVDACDALDAHTELHWASPDSAPGRVWIVGGHLHLVSPAIVHAVAQAAGVDPASLASSPHTTNNTDDDKEEEEEEPAPNEQVRRVLDYLATDPNPPSSAPTLTGTERAEAEQEPPPLRADVGCAIVRSAWSIYTRAPEDVEAQAFSKVLPPMPEKADTSLPLPPALHAALHLQHVTLAVVPPLVAKVLHANPQALSTAAHVFLARDRHEARAAHRMQRFGTGASLYLPPEMESCVCELIAPEVERQPTPRSPPHGLTIDDVRSNHAVLVPVGLSRRLYAALVDENYVPPPPFGKDWVDGVVAYHHLRRQVIAGGKGLCRTLNLFRQRHYEVGRWMDLGAKLAVGMEMAYAASIERRQRFPSTTITTPSPPEPTTEQREFYRSSLEALGYASPSPAAIDRAVQRSREVESVRGDDALLDGFAPLVEAALQEEHGPDLSALRPVEQMDYEVPARWFESARVHPSGKPPKQPKEEDKEEQEYADQAQNEAESMLATLGQQMDRFLHREGDYRGATFDDDNDQDDDEDEEFSEDDAHDMDVEAEGELGDQDTRAKQQAHDRFRALNPQARAEAQQNLVAPLDGSWGAANQAAVEAAEVDAASAPPQVKQDIPQFASNRSHVAPTPPASRPALVSGLTGMSGSAGSAALVGSVPNPPPSLSGSLSSSLGSVAPLSSSSTSMPKTPQSSTLGIDPLGTEELAALFPSATGASKNVPTDSGWRPSGFSKGVLSNPNTRSTPSVASNNSIGTASAGQATKQEPERPAKKTRPNPGPTSVNTSTFSTQSKKPTKSLMRGFLLNRATPSAMEGTQVATPLQAQAEVKAQTDQVKALRASIPERNPLDGAEGMDDDESDPEIGAASARVEDSSRESQEDLDAIPDTEVEAFLRFAVEQLGLNEEQYNAIVQERRAKGAYVPGDDLDTGEQAPPGLPGAQLRTFDQVMDKMDENLAQHKTDQPKSAPTSQDAAAPAATPTPSQGKGKGKAKAAPEPELEQEVVSDSDDEEMQDAQLLSHLARTGDDLAGLAAYGSQNDMQAHAGSLLDGLERPQQGGQQGMIGVQALLARLRQAEAGH